MSRRASATTSIGVAIVAIVAIGARPTRACEPPIVEVPRLTEVPLPFDGVEVPTNAELRVANTRTPRAATLLDRDGDDGDIDIEIVVDEQGAVLVAPAGGWPVGTHELTIVGGEREERLVQLVVVAGIDDEAPVAGGVERGTISTGRWQLFPLSTCDLEVPQDRELITFTNDGSFGLTDVAWLVVGPQIAPVVDGQASIVVDENNTGGVMLRDHAGNDSDAFGSIAGGCHSGAAPDVVGLGLILLLTPLVARRRRGAAC